MDLGELHERCVRQVRRLALRAPLDLGAVCDQVAGLRGRPLRLLPMTARPGDPTGIWIASATADYVFYEERTSRLHRDHIVLHEIGHMLFGHAGAAVLDDHTARMLLPNLDPKMVRRVLARSNYSAQDEQEAEMFASLVLAETGFAVAPESMPEPPEELSELLRRIWSVLGSPADQA